ncbi:hypothetical protein AMJ80_11255 [bacterium SM23_31]|nr:MAG: hypothetical protein AMJ80_11255 [bacterium SM23_31]
MKKLKIFLFIAAFSAVFTFQHRSCAQVVVAHSVISGGGVSSSNGIYGITGTIGQPIVGTSGITPHTIKAGFWNQISYIIIVPLTTIPWNIALPAGWSMVSLGLDIGDASRSGIFPDAISVYEFEKRYNMVTDLSKGKGYWVNLSKAYSTTIEDRAIDKLVLNLTEGWHMIGTISYPLAVGNITQDVPNSIKAIYKYDRCYSRVTDSLRQGEGYWIKVSNNATLTFGPGNLFKTPVVLYGNDFNKDTEFTLPVIFQTGSRSKALNIIFTKNADPAELTALSSMFELPPLPPAGILDVRFLQENTNGLEALFITEDAAAERDILLSIPYDEQLVVKWNKSMLEPGRFMLKDGMGGALFSDIDMSLTDELIVTSTALIPLSGIKFSYLGQDRIVSDYKLLPNYPNPFNPETTIGFQVPKSSFVTLKIYNILGNEVKTLMNKNVAPGSYSVKWDGTDNYGKKASSGVYIYIIRADTGFIQSRRLLLIR